MRKVLDTTGGERMLRSFSVLVSVVLLLAEVTSAGAVVKIGDDRGGQIGPYLNRFASVRNSGELVMIDGPCLSACTLIVGAVPSERICVTKRASLGFHAAWNFATSGQPVFSPEGTRLLWEFYPPPVRRWIKRRGGLTPHMIFLRGSELAHMYRLCR